MDTTQTNTAETEDQYREQRKKRTDRKNRKLAESPEIMSTGTRNKPILVEMDPLPNSLVLAKKHKET